MSVYDVRIGDLIRVTVPGGTTLQGVVYGIDGDIVFDSRRNILFERDMDANVEVIRRPAREPKPGDRVRTRNGEGFVVPENRLVIQYVDGSWDVVSEVLDTLEFLDD